LNVGDLPRRMMRKVKRWSIRFVKVDDVESFTPSDKSVGCTVTLAQFGTYEANTTSLPLGDIDAEPTGSLTLMLTSRSNVVLWKADGVVAGSSMLEP